MWLDIKPALVMAILVTRTIDRVRTVPRTLLHVLTDGGLANPYI